MLYTCALRSAVSFFHEQVVDEDIKSESDLVNGDNGNYNSYGNGTDGHKRQKRQALVNWTWRLSNVSFL